MDNKKIPTCLGTIILVIIAITAGAFVWVYEKGQQTTEQSQQGINTRKPVATQTPQNSQSDEPVTVNSTKTITYTNNTYGFSFQYPSDLTISSASTENQIMLAGDNGNGHWVYDIRIVTNTNNFSLKQAFDQEVKKVNYKTIKTDIIVDGKPAKRLSAQETHDYGNAEVVLIFKNKIVRIFGDDSSVENKANFDKFIQTFSFSN